MNLTARQRKLLYGFLIVVLTIPIIWLGRPATKDDSGGQLAGMRAEYKLGEASLGEIDPSSATMNLVLLGLRGIATDVLWIDAIEQKRTKNWGQLRTTVKSITLLQPHYIKVWDFQGWNLAYNVSAEWDAVAGRYYWVKEGAKFLQDGTSLNRDVPELPYWEGRIIGQKIGVADEWRYYRRYFKVDPDPQFQGGPDPEINPLGLDNYLAGRLRYLEANEKEAKPGVDQHIEARYLFRSKPAHSLIDFAMVQHREGVFGEVSKKAWEDAYVSWTEDFGREEYASLRGNSNMRIRMDTTDEELLAVARQNDVSPDEENIAVEALRRDVTSMQNIVNYRYWKRRANAEQQDTTVEAHRLLYRAEQAVFEENNLDEALQLVEKGLTSYNLAFNEYFQDIKGDEFAIEEALKGVLLLRYIHSLRGTTMPDPAKYGSTIGLLWLSNQASVPQLEATMLRQQRGSD
ncbi:MAG: hypothetical protein HON53_24810 [Planctomycetaceae bacterium]|jgi:hypothetical protein|nr:hypothetical protein [Planctomycetaceae bacterium]MBT6155168.1 hypothetical protein [Planctomycetaceae bacterium]MBT6483316.1 hypothetical protein [Planctomycetaceae bacterium]MBT6497479.1 hypothetical protein [Planctomycetaceae bacterium]